MKRLFLVGLISISLSGCDQLKKDDRHPLVQNVMPSYEAAEKWFLESIRDKGLFRYTYFPKTDEYPSKNNAIRQLMAARLLAEMSNENSKLLPLHRKNISFYLKNWYKENDEIGYVHYSKKSKLGANAMLLRALVWSPDFEEYEDKAKKLADGILSLMDENGAFMPFLIKPDYDYDPDYLLTFYSGEALVALVEYYEKTKDEKYLNAAIRSQEYYIDRYVINLADNYYPAYVPWHTISLNKLWKITGNDIFSESIFILNNKLLETLDRTNYIGRFYNPSTPQYGSPHISSDGVYTEGLAYALEIAQLKGNQYLQEIYLQALTLAVQNIKSLQYNKENTARFKRPDRVIGSFRKHVDGTSTRIDNVQHIMDAYRKLMDIL